VDLNRSRGAVCALATLTVVLSVAGCSGQSSTSEASQSPFASHAAVASQEASAIVGLSSTDARAKVKSDGFDFFVALVDGHWQGGVLGPNPHRINVRIKDDVVVGATAG
jgi:ABC-type phosphate transport system substrate-binding protein